MNPIKLLIAPICIVTVDYPGSELPLKSLLRLKQGPRLVVVEGAIDTRQIVVKFPLNVASAQG